MSLDSTPSAAARSRWPLFQITHKPSLSAGRPRQPFVSAFRPSSVVADTPTSFFQPHPPAVYVVEDDAENSRQNGLFLFGSDGSGGGMWAGVMLKKTFSAMKAARRAGFLKNSTFISVSIRREPRIPLITLYIYLAISCDTVIFKTLAKVCPL